MNDSLLGDFDAAGFVYLSGSTARQVAFLAGRDQLVKRGHVVARADLAGVLGVVVEILVGHDPVFVADQPELRRPWPG